MRAVRLSRTGDPSVLRIDDVAAPRPPTGDRIFVRVAASSINGTDLGLRRGVPGAAMFGRLVGLGFDIAGEVAAVGPAVTAFAPGDRVAALLPHNGAARPRRSCCARAGPRSCSPASTSSRLPGFRWPA